MGREGHSTLDYSTRHSQSAVRAGRILGRKFGLRFGCADDSGRDDSHTNERKHRGRTKADMGREGHTTLDYSTRHSQSAVRAGRILGRKFGLRLGCADDSGWDDSHTNERKQRCSTKADTSGWDAERLTTAQGTAKAQSEQGGFWGGNSGCALAVPTIAGGTIATRTNESTEAERKRTWAGRGTQRLTIARAWFSIAPCP